MSDVQRTWPCNYPYPDDCDGHDADGIPIKVSDVQRVMLPCEHGFVVCDERPGWCHGHQGTHGSEYSDVEVDCPGGRVVEINYEAMSQEAERLGWTHSASDLEKLAAALGIGDKP